MPEQVKKKPRGRPFEKGNQFATRANRKQEDAPPPDVSDALPDEKEALRALWARAQSGKQGSTAAYKTYLEYLVGKARQRDEMPSGPKLSEETAARLATIATKLTTKCAYCGKPVGGPSVELFVSQEQANDSSGFKAFDPPAPPKAQEPQEPEEKSQPPMRYRADDKGDPDPTADHKGPAYPSI